MMAMLTPARTVVLSASGNDYNAFTAAGSPLDPCFVVATVTSAVNQSVAAAAFSSGTFAGGSLLVLINNSTITGKTGTTGVNGTVSYANLLGSSTGGAGGPTGNNPGSAGTSSPGWASSFSNAGNGGNGGAALLITTRTVLINNGSLVGGAGGSAGNGLGTVSTALATKYGGTQSVGLAGAGGGGGGGLTGPGGSGGSTNYPTSYEGYIGVGVPGTPPSGGGGNGGANSAAGSTGNGGAAAVGGAAGAWVYLLWSTCPGTSLGANAGSQGVYLSGASLTKIQTAGSTSGGTTG